MTDQRQNRHNLESLLIDELIDGLDEQSTSELESLLAHRRDVDRHAFERTAAVLFLAANAGSAEAMPEGLGKRLEADAKTLFAPGNESNDQD